MDIIIAYGVALAFFLAMDLFWIKVLAAKFYRRNIGSFLRDSPRIGPAVGFYTVYVIAVLYFVAMPQSYSTQPDIVHIALSGAFFGAVAYGTYDITNYALVEGWPLNVTIADIIWGGFVTACTSVVAFSML